MADTTLEQESIPPVTQNSQEISPSDFLEEFSDFSDFLEKYLQNYDLGKIEKNTFAHL